MNLLFTVDFVILVCCICDDAVLQFTVINAYASYAFSAESVVILIFSYYRVFPIDTMACSSWSEFIIQSSPKKRYPCFIFVITSINVHRF